jgi:predicted ATPase
VNRFVVISGCSGGGKSTLLAELGRRGHTVVEEPGRRIVVEEMNNGGSALPWVDMAAFARRAITTALADRSSTPASGGWIFFDRSSIDAAIALQHLTRESVLEEFAQTHRYHRRVFLAPPWPELTLQIESCVTAPLSLSLSIIGFSKPIRRWATRFLSCRGSG